MGASQICTPKKITFCFTLTLKEDKGVYFTPSHPKSAGKPETPIPFVKVLL